MFRTCALAVMSITLAVAIASDMMIAQASPTPPHLFFGGVESGSGARVDGELAADGSAVTASNERGEAVGTSNTSRVRGEPPVNEAGTWAIQVSTDDAASVTFRINGSCPSDAVDVVSGLISEISLDVIISPDCSAKPLPGSAVGTPDLREGVQAPIDLVWTHRTTPSPCSGTAWARLRRSVSGSERQWVSVIVVAAANCVSGAAGGINGSVLERTHFTTFNRFSHSALRLWRIERWHVVRNIAGLRITRQSRCRRLPARCYDPAMAHRSYSEELKQAAVARHLAGESQAAIAENIGVPRQTVTSWAASADGIRQSLDSAPFSLKRKLADQASGVIHKALHIIDATLEHYIAQIEVGEHPKPLQLRDITVTAGISRDIHLDYTDGRKGTKALGR